jgi:hypothetical protein
MFLNTDSFNFVDNFQDSKGWLPRKMLNAAKKITMPMRQSVLEKNTGQMLLWGLLLFYENNQNENLSAEFYRRPDGEFTLTGFLVNFYIEKFLKTHRAGIAIRKHNKSKFKWKNQDAFDIVRNYITTHVMSVPKQIMKIASQITKEKQDAIKSKDIKQLYLWGVLLFLYYGENENMDHPGYRTSDDKLTLDAKFIKFYLDNRIRYSHYL